MGFLLIVTIIICGLIYYFKCYKVEKNSVYINNALVILIGIGEYDEKPTNDEVNAYLKDLDGIDHDIENMVYIFHEELNYDIYPLEYLNVNNNKDYAPKLYWTEKELHEFLVDRAKYLEENIYDNKKYDGLIVIISAHGIQGNICSSDYKPFSKLAIHRIFSSPHPNSREIPRVFIFDCCSGNNEQEAESDSDSKTEEEEQEEKNVGKRIKEDDISKGVDLADITSDGGWLRGQHNPDYMLAVISAANPGFQAKLASDIGSYVIHSFGEKTLENLTENKRKYSHTIFDEIQNELEQKGKQHPTYIWNNSTRYIRFKKNNKLNTSHHAGKGKYSPLNVEEDSDDETAIP